jgi:hypothetical protein
MVFMACNCFVASVTLSIKKMFNIENIQLLGWGGGAGGGPYISEVSTYLGILDMFMYILRQNLHISPPSLNNACRNGRGL